MFSWAFDGGLLNKPFFIPTWESFGYSGPGDRGAVASDGRYLYMISGRGSTAIRKIDPVTRTHVVVATLPQETIDCWATWHNGQLWFYGGGPYYTNHTGNLYRWNEVEGLVLESVHTPRRRHEVIVYQNKIYVFGGSLSSANAKSGSVYDITNKTWTDFTIPGNGMIGVSAAVVGNLIYLFFGAYDGWGVRSVISRFDPATNTFLPDIPNPISGRMQASIVKDSNGDILLYGGNNYLPTTTLFKDLVRYKVGVGEIEVVQNPMPNGPSDPLWWERRGCQVGDSLYIVRETSLHRMPIP